MRRAVIGVVISLLAVSVEAETLRIHGSNTVGDDLAPRLARAWLTSEGFASIATLPQGENEVLIRGERDGGIREVFIAAHGSSTGFKALQAGQADLGMSSRPIRPGEQAVLEAAGRIDQLTASEHVVALDGVAVVVHPDIAVDQLSIEQLKGIFTGEISDWRSAGAAAQQIRVHARDDRSGTFDTFSSLVLGEQPLTAEASRYESNARLSDTVAASPGSIGFTGLPYIRDAKPLAVREGQAQALAPLPFSVAVEDYALARRLYFYLPNADEHPIARQFIEFALSKRGQNEVASVGFVPLSIQAGSWAVPADAPEQYRALTKDARRLSTTFRFDEGESRLDSRSRRDLERLMDWWQQNEGDNQLMVFGFSDSTESAPFLAHHLANSRADDVANELLRAGVAPTKVRGFGAQLPIASNQAASGRSKNRRVEIWVKRSALPASRISDANNEQKAQGSG